MNCEKVGHRARDTSFFLKAAAAAEIYTAWVVGSVRCIWETAILREVTVSRNAQAFGVNEANKEAILAAGKTIHTLTAAQRAEWKAAMRPVWDQFKDDVGQDNIDAAQAINAKY